MNLSELMRYMAEKSGAVVNIEALHPAFFSAESLKLAPDQYLHHGEYCLYAKLSGPSYGCSRNKSRSTRIAGFGRCFYGPCPNGIWDLAYPVIRDGKAAATVYMGHFRVPGRELKQFPPRSFNREIPLITPEKIAELKKDAAYLAQFVAIEIDRFINSGGLAAKHRDEKFYALNSRRYIDGKYREDISLSDLAETMNMNPNYLGGLLKQYCGKSFRQLLNERRVEEAKVYLKLHRQLSISRIALFCGFNDTNYFSVVFKRLTGQTPSEWRD